MDTKNKHTIVGEDSWDIDLSGREPGTDGGPGTAGQKGPDGPKGNNGDCDTWGGCDHSAGDGYPGTAGTKGVDGVKGGRGQDGSNGTFYISEIYTSITVYSNGTRGGNGGAGGMGGQGGNGGPGGDGGSCCSSGEPGAGANGGPGGNGGAGGDGGNGGIVTLLYNKMPGGALRGNAAGGAGGVGGAKGTGGPGGSGKTSGSSGADGVEGISGNNGVNGNLITKKISPLITLTDIAPAEGPAAGGTDVTIFGSNFLQAPDGTPMTQVKIGGNDVIDLKFIDSGTLQGKTPAGSGQAFVVAINPDGSIATLDKYFVYV